MNDFKKVFFYLKGFIGLSIIVIVTSLVSCFFEGVSIGILVPILQSMMSKSSVVSINLPFFDRFQHFFAGWGQKQVLPFLIIFVFFAILLKNFLAYAGSITAVKLRYMAVKMFMEKLFNKILDCSNSFYDSIKTGHIVNSISYETNRMGDAIFCVLNFISTSVRVLIYVLILGLVSWKFSLFVMVFFLLTMPVIQRVIKKIKVVGEISSIVSSNFNFILLEILSGIRVVKNFNTEEHEKQKFDHASSELVKAGYRYEKYNHLIPPLSETVVLGLLVILFLIVVKVVNLDMARIIPYVLIYILVLNRTMVQVNSLNHLKGRLAGNMAAFNTYEKILSDAERLEIPRGDKRIENLKEGIVFKDVSFSYVDGYEVLKDINIEFPVGKTTAIVGATGAGKSTLINLIPRLYDLSRGMILVDGIPLNQLDNHYWRRKIGIVSQDVFIFNAPIKENICYGNFDLSEEEIIRTAKMANAHEFITKLPDGYNTVVGDRGVRLSGGQKQRISIARAIINAPEILILDEATSSLDTETEKLIQEAIDRLARFQFSREKDSERSGGSSKKTVIAIAHRLSTIKSADNIIVLDQGKVVEQGRHEDLMTIDGYYKKFYDLQYGNV